MDPGPSLVIVLVAAFDYHKNVSNLHHLQIITKTDSSL